ncbi:MAG: PilN domain-containing protein [candidate division WOR-3 bacterium]
MRPRLQKIGDISNLVSRRLMEGFGALWRILSLSLGDDRVSPKSGLSVSLDGSGVSTAYGSRRLSKIKIKNLQSFPVTTTGFPSPETFATTVLVALTKMRTKQRSVVLGIPKAWVVMKRVELPSTVKENLPGVISYELDRLTPFSSDEAFYDFQLLKEENGKLVLMLAAVKADTLNPYLYALREQGISVSAVTVNLSALGTLANYLSRTDTTLFVQVDQNQYEGALYALGSAVEVFTGRFNGEGPESRAEHVVGQANKVLERTGFAHQPAFIFFLKETADEAPFRNLVPDATLIVGRKGADRLSLPAEQNAVPYTSIGALVESLWPPARGFNLLSRGRHRKIRPPIGLTLFLLVVLAALGAIYVLAPLSIEGKRVEEIDRQIALREDEARRVEALRSEVEGLENEVKTIAQFKKGRPLSINLMKEITALLPSAVWLSRLRIGDASIDMEGYAPSASELLGKLEASPYLRKVEFASPTFRDARMNADRFIVRMEIEGVVPKEKTRGEAQQ